MKISALIPILSGYKSHNSSIENRPFVNIGGEPLINRTINLINKVYSIDEIAIFSSSNDVINYISSNKYKFYKRPESLDKQKTSIEDIVDSFIKVSDADIFLLIHPKSPFLNPLTIQDCIENVINGDFDSAFLATSVRKHAWMNGKRLNYSQDEDTPHLLDIEPVIFESSSVYVFSRSVFEKYRSRIGEYPYIKIVNHLEGFEIDVEDDFEMAELIINAGLEKSRR